MRNSDFVLGACARATAERSFKWVASWLLVGAIALQFLGSCKAGKGCTQDSDCGPGGVCAKDSKVCFSPLEAAPVIVTTRLPEGIVSRPYEYRLQAGGGTSPLDWALVDEGPELNWLSVNADSGALSGTPVSSQSVPLTVQVKDAVGRVDKRAFNLSVRNCVPGEIFDCAAPSGEACFNGRQNCTASGQVGICSLIADSRSSDRSHCGPSCSPCSTSADRCADGVCKCGSANPCSGAAPQCCGNPDGARCVNVQSNPDFCGGCGTSCDRDRRNVIRGCDAGHCDYLCAPGWGRCPADSIDCQTDLTKEENCGHCGNRCLAPDGGSVRCESAQCRQACPASFQLCNGACFSLTDLNHCGNCTRVCDARVADTCGPDGQCYCGSEPACGSGLRCNPIVHTCVCDSDPCPTFITLLSDCGSSGNCYLQVKNTRLPINSDNLPILGCAPGSQNPYPPDCSEVLGVVDRQGRISLPAVSIVFPPAFIDLGPAGIVRVDFEPKADGTGNIDRVGGSNTLLLNLRLRLTNPFFPAGCGIGDPSVGISIALTTGTDGTLTGRAYDQQSAASQVVNQRFVAPITSNCGSAGPWIDDRLGLPTVPGDNKAEFRLQYTPTL